MPSMKCSRHASAEGFELGVVVIKEDLPGDFISVRFLREKEVYMLVKRRDDLLGVLAYWKEGRGSPPVQTPHLGP